MEAHPHFIRTHDDLLSKCKHYFERHFMDFFGHSLDLILVVDANIVLSEARVYVKQGKTHLLSFASSPFLKLKAPKYIRQELDKNIPILSKRNKMKEEEFRSAVEIILQHVELVDRIDDESYMKASDLINKNDPKDVPYAALYFSVKAHAVFSKDPHLDSPSIVRWDKTGKVSRTVGVLEKGSVSFFILAEAVPDALKIMGELFSYIINGILSFAKRLISAIGRFIERGIEAISEMSAEMQLFLIGLGVLLMNNKEFRSFAGQLIREMVLGIKALLQWFYDMGRNLLQVIVNAVEVGLIGLTSLLEDVRISVETCEKINARTDGYVP